MSAKALRAAKQIRIIPSSADLAMKVGHRPESTASNQRQMNEYNVTFTAPEEGSILLDVHTSTGTSRYAKFGSPQEIRRFLSSLGLHERKVAEVDAICSNLRAGEAYHEKMFLPESVIAAIKNLATGTDGMGNIPMPTLPTSVATTDLAA